MRICRLIYKEMGCTLGVGYSDFFRRGVQNVFRIFNKIFALVINSNSKLFTIFFQGVRTPLGKAMTWE